MQAILRGSARRRPRGRRVTRALTTATGIALALALSIDAIANISSQSGPYRRTLDRGYASLANPLALASNTTGSLLATIMGTGPSMDRLTLFSDTDVLASQSKDTWAQFSRITPPNPVGSAGQLCASAIEERASAAVSARGALQGVLGGNDGRTYISEAAAVSMLEQAASEIARSDASWGQCRHDLFDAPGSARITASDWSTGPQSNATGPQSNATGPQSNATGQQSNATGQQSNTAPPRSYLSAAFLQSYVAALSNSPSLAPMHRLAVVAVRVEPPPIDTSGTGVIPPTKSLIVSVTVDDDGNVDEPDVLVSALATPQGAPTTQTPISVQAITTIASRSSATMNLPAIQVVPGTSYTLRFSAQTEPGPGQTSASTTVSVQVAQAVTTTTTMPPARTPTKSRT